MPLHVKFLVCDLVRHQKKGIYVEYDLCFLRSHLQCMILCGCQRVLLLVDVCSPVYEGSGAELSFLDV